MTGYPDKPYIGSVIEMLTKLLNYAASRINAREVDTESDGAKAKFSKENLAYWRGYNLGLQDARGELVDSARFAWEPDKN